MASDSEQSFAALLPKLTLQEKVALLSGNSFNTTPGIPRLGIPQIKVCPQDDSAESPGCMTGSNTHMQFRSVTRSMESDRLRLTAT